MASRNRSRNLSKPKSSKGSSLSDPSPLLGKGAQNGRQKGRKATKPSLLLSLSLCLYPIPCSIFLPTKLFPRANQLLVKLRESKAVELSLVSLIETEDRYIQFQCFCLICQHTGASCSWWPRHSRSPLMREHTREKQRQRQKEKMVEGDGKGARDLRTRVTERDRRVSLVGLATNRVFNGEPFAFNPLSPCDLILLQSQDRRNPVHYIYISIPFICHRIGLPERLMVADIELNFSNLTRLDGDISFLPWIPRFSSI